jgi:serine beta-lactamase-like protein LACTB
MRVDLKLDRLCGLPADSGISRNHWAFRLRLARRHWSDIVNGEPPYPSSKTRTVLIEVDQEGPPSHARTSVQLAQRRAATQRRDRCKSHRARARRGTRRRFRVPQRCRSTIPFTLIAVSLLAGPRAAAQRPSVTDPVAEARPLVEALRQAVDIPGLAVAVGVGHRIVWEEGFGVADLQSGTLVTSHTRFRAASVSKVLTIAGLARLYADGRVDLDAPISRYVPSYSGRPGVTARRLAGHLAGIRHYRDGDDTLGFRHFDSVTAALAAFASDSLVAPPGTRYHYSTFGYTLLAAAMERAAGQPFMQFMQRSVFSPLEMRQTGPDEQSAILTDRSAYYNRDADGVLRNAPFEDPSYKWAGGGFLTTAPDLVRFAMAHLDAGFLPERVLTEMFQSQRTADGKETGVGLGWRIGTDGAGRRIVHHAGSMNGARSVVMFWPDLGVSVAIMTNLRGTPTFIEQTAEIVAGPWLRQAEGGDGEPSVSRPVGRFTYVGVAAGDSARGWIELAGKNGTPSWIEAPGRLTAIFKANGLPISGRFEIPGVYVEKGVLNLILATPFGLLPMRVGPRGSGGFTGEMRAPAGITFILEATPTSPENAPPRRWCRTVIRGSDAGVRTSPNTSWPCQ